ncbi:MAG: hypothetical protein F7C08_00785 [Desulfurococcales archaeon]|nr:hypothetical protein [Desulfurococcales archaeon]MCE4605059.1 hypothetical protein [Desulfurococcales archaeon]
MQSSPVAKLADAVTWLESELKRLESEARGKANEVVRLGDMLAREIKNDIDIVTLQAIEEARRRVEEESKRLEKEYRNRIEEEVAALKVRAEAFMNDAVKQLVAEIKAILGGV